MRQLNMYGFRKIRHNDEDNVYMNDNFRLNGKHLLKNINRKVKEDKEEQVEVYQQPVNTVNRQIQ